jgi:hypothetical protein
MRGQPSEICPTSDQSGFRWSLASRPMACPATGLRRYEGRSADGRSTPLAPLQGRRQDIHYEARLRLLPGPRRLVARGHTGDQDAAIGPEGGRRSPAWREDRTRMIAISPTRSPAAQRRNCRCHPADSGTIPASGDSRHWPCLREERAPYTRPATRTGMSKDRDLRQHISPVTPRYPDAATRTGSHHRGTFRPAARATPVRAGVCAESRRRAVPKSPN